MKRVFITGIGALTPLGHCFEATWEALKAGRSGIAAISRFDARGLNWKVAGELKGFGEESIFSPREMRRTDRFTRYAVAAAGMALNDAGLEPPLQACVIIGSSRAGVETLEKAALSKKISPYAMPSSTAGMAASLVAQRFGLMGHCLGISSACCSGAQAVGEAMRLVRHGYGNVVVCGGAEAPITRLCIEGFGRTGALSTDGSPQASRPFDSERDGFVLSEGACVLVLESHESALRRGAKIYAEVAGYGNSVDVPQEAISGDVRPPGFFNDVRPSAGGQAAAMRRALEDAGMKEEEICLLSAHATSTVMGDKTEEEAIRVVFRDRTEGLPVVAAKSLTGHMLSASGPLEAAIALMCMKEGIVPPYPHLRRPDSKLLIRPEGGRVDARAALVNSWGFGGMNACLVLKIPSF